MIVTKTFATTIQYWEFSAKHLDEIVFKLVRLKNVRNSLSCNKFTGLLKSNKE